MTIPRSWLYRILAAALGAAALLWLVQSRDGWRDEARANGQLFRSEQAAHGATVANYRAAAEQARREDAETLARVKAEQAEINERTGHDFETRVAAARAVAERLRQQADDAAADPRSGGGSPVPGFPRAAGGVAEGAGKDGLPQSDRLIATEQAIQLDELIKWVKAQGQVKVAPAN
jgi:signal transduction histidine kinase